ncbi:subtilisin-like protease SBT1.7 isoform X2 [Tasmannia lanceolata]|uniref:subtilisin-like protease SBT1.7 isoform X2 n=1 Tax=Tasmannia lanceolata TaxID=3420 RepID=UPI0040645BA9
MGSSSFMALKSSSTLSTYLLILILTSLLSIASYSTATTRASKSKFDMSSYIINTHNFSRPSHFPTQHDWYSFMLQSVVNGNSNLTTHDHFPTQHEWSSLMLQSVVNGNSCLTTHDRIFYIYDTAMNGFAAKLTAQEAQNMAKIPGVINVYPDRMIKLQTTRSPDFIGLNANYGLWPKSNFGEGVIIGFVDSGIWPESDSFKDDGLGPVGPEWKGECEFESSLCNNKLIGARFFYAGAESLAGPIDEEAGEYSRSPRDASGHGTPVASIAAGAAVANANLFGFAVGTARGMASKARIAMYKACWAGHGCADSDILAAIEKAIEDGVHVLSLSLGANDPTRPYYQNPTGIGAFAAIEKGIFVAGAAGNSGPSIFSVTNSEPWTTTVASGTIDRTFPAQIILGNGEVYEGVSLYDEKVNASITNTLVLLNYCNSTDIVRSNVMDKIVVCKGGDVGTSILVLDAVGAGLAILDGVYIEDGVPSTAFTVPGLRVADRRQKITTYMNSTQNPKAALKLDGVTIVGENRAPFVHYTSSRGPNPVVPQLLKPDILAPGVNILAAWIPIKAPTGFDYDTRMTAFNMLTA